ncbi:unnamed protein product [Parajaminaea phylloscopi]
MASNARRLPVRTRTTIGRDGTSSTMSSSNGAVSSAAGRVTRATSEVDAVASKAAGAAAGSSLGVRKRAALGDLTNANRARSTGSASSSRGAEDKAGKDATGKVTKVSAATGSKVPRAESSTMAGKRLATRATATREAEQPVTSTATGTAASRVTRRVAGTTAPSSRAATATATRATAARSQTAASSTTARRAQQHRRDQVPEEEQEVDEAARDPKRLKTEDSAVVTITAATEDAAVATGPAKDEGWEDLDAEDADDPLMVAEYVNEIFHYMKRLEMTTMPNGSYMDTQTEIDWGTRGILVDWLIDIHAKFRMLPETLFLALNVVDRFLTTRAISLNKLQLVGLTAMFIAAKYEEVLCPSVGNFLFLADGGYDTDEILKAERYMLKVLGFNLSYANPMNFLRRISKADNYDIQTRTVAKYFMEISLVDYRLLEHPPSLVAAASIWMARKVLERGPWTPTLVHYSSYSEYELLGTAEIMLDYTLRPIQHNAFHKKYAAKKFMRASNYVVEWARTTYPESVVPESEAEEQDWGSLRVDLFTQEGLLRPTSSSNSSTASGDAGSRATSPSA